MHYILCPQSLLEQNLSILVKFLFWSVLYALVLMACGRTAPNSAAYRCFYSAGHLASCLIPRNVHMRWRKFQGKTLSLEEIISKQFFIFPLLVPNLTPIHYGNANKNSKFILSGNSEKMITTHFYTNVQTHLSEVVIQTQDKGLSFIIVSKSPLIRKRPRNSELRNKLKFNKENYKLSLVLKMSA